MPWLIYESINLSFPNNTILSCFFFFFLIIDLYFLIPAEIAQIFNPTAELVIPTGTRTKEANAEIETQPHFHSLNHCALFHLKDNFLLH